MKNKVFKYIGNILMILSLAFIIYKLATMDIDYHILLDPRTLVWLVILSGLYALHIALLPISWKNIIYMITGKNLPLISVQKTFCKANLMKYIPGNIFQYVGRNEIAIEYDLSHKKVALTTVLDIGANVLGVLIISLVGYMSGWQSWLDNNRQNVSLIIKIALIVLAVFVILGILLRKHLIRFWKKICSYFTIRNFKIYLKCVLIYMFFAVYTGLIYVVILQQILNMPISYRDFPILVGAYLLSWLLGFLMPGAPGGIGIREAALTLFLAGRYDIDGVLLGIIIYRLINTIGDFVGFFGVSVIYHYKRKIKGNQEINYEKKQT